MLVYWLKEKSNNFGLDVRSNPFTPKANINLELPSVLAVISN